MKTPTNAVLLSLLVLGSCATSRNVVVSETVGPAARIGRHTPGQGSLIVYSGPDISSGLDSSHTHHSTYWIYSTQGGLVQKVRNRAGSFEESPSVVLLPTGAYKVQAWARNCGMVEIPILINEDKTTTLYLDGDAQPLGTEGNPNDFVYPPNGTIAGWRAAK